MREGIKVFLACIIVFIVAVLSGWILHKPKIITKIEQVKVYDLTQSADIIEAYYNAMGKVSMEKNELTKIKLDYWDKGYSEGYRTAKRKCINE